jgi:hypothetical protein
VIIELPKPKKRNKAKRLSNCWLPLFFEWKVYWFEPVEKIYDLQTTSYEFGTTAWFLVGVVPLRSKQGTRP